MECAGVTALCIAYKSGVKPFDLCEDLPPWRVADVESGKYRYSHGPTPLPVDRFGENEKGP